MTAHTVSTQDGSYPTARRRLRGLGLALIGAMTLGACSAMPKIGSIASIIDVEKPPAPVASAPPAAAIDYGTSIDIHPEIWPLGTSGVARDPAVEARITELLAQMTLEEKVGQLLQPDIASATPEDVRHYHVGSILNSGDTAPGGNLRAPATEWLKAADAYYDASIDVPAGRPAIPLIWGIDAMHGNDHIVGATLFPHNIGLGAMNDPDLVRKIGEATAQEMRVTGQDWAFAPVIAVVRDDRWGRTYEGYSEAPKIVSEYTAAMIEGLQGKPGDPDFLKNGHIIATAKHYIGDGGTDGGVDQGDNLYSETGLRDIFAPPYEAAIKAGVQTVMASYSSWRGQKMHDNKSLLDDVLFGRMGFDGFVVSDYHGVAQVPGCSRTDCPASINAGIDMVMTATNWKSLYDNTLTDVRDGKIPAARLDEAVGRILRVKLRAGVMAEGKPSLRAYAGQWDQLGSPDHRAIARQAVRESLVLLKNDGGILPLSPRLHVLVAGDGADNMAKQAGGWTISWQGNGNSRADFPHADTIYDGIKANVEAAGGTATLSAGGDFGDKPDVAIVVFGEEPYAEGRGDRPDVDFASHDDRNLALLQKLRAQGIPVVSVFLSGRPLFVTPEINASDAFVAAWLPGSEGGGIADVLFSKPDGSVASDFRGKLSFSWPRSPKQTSVNVGTEPYFPLFAYGFGLTYSTPRNIGLLPEAASASVAAAAINTFVDSGRATSPWSLSLIDVTGKRTAADPAPATVPTAALRVVRGDRNRQQDTLIATWSGLGKASIAAAASEPANFTKQTNDGMTLTLDLRVDTAPTAPVALAMGNATALGKVDLTQALRAAHGRGWTKIAIPLSCFRNTGADMGAVTVPMALTTSGRMAISLYVVQAQPSAGPASCPGPEISKTPVGSKTYANVKPRAKTNHHSRAKTHVKAKAHAKPRPHVKLRKRHVR